MKRARRGTLLLGLAVLIGGCSIAGTWETISVTPEEFAEKFAFQRVTFGDRGTYTGMGMYGKMQINSKGEYDWNGMRLRIEPENGEAREYRGTLWWGDTLVLEHDHQGTIMKGTLKKQTN